MIVYLKTSEEDAYVLIGSDSKILYSALGTLFPKRKTLFSAAIPAERDLWKMENFDAFLEARKLLIRDRLRDLLLIRAETQAAGG